MVECAKCGEFIMLGAADLAAPQGLVEPPQKTVEFELNLNSESDGAPAGLGVPMDSPKTTVLDINYDQLNKTQIVQPPPPSKPADPLPAMSCNSVAAV